jgi:hypothetical protein
MNGIQGVQDTEATRDAIAAALLAQQAGFGGVGGLAPFTGVGGGTLGAPRSNQTLAPGAAGANVPTLTGFIPRAPGTVADTGLGEMPGAQAPTPGGGSPYGMGMSEGAMQAAADAALSTANSPFAGESALAIGQPGQLGSAALEGGFNAITASDAPTLPGIAETFSLGGYPGYGVDTPGLTGGQAPTAIGSRGGTSVTGGPVSPNTGFNVGFDTGFNTGFDAGAAAAAGGGEGMGGGEGPAGAGTPGGPGGPDAGTGTEGGHGGEGS